jgi:hypothetical protein
LSHYGDVLKELKEKGERLANQYIMELYTILRGEEKLSPEDCRARIERDCPDLWSKATIRKYLPPEAMNPKKQIAGKIGADEKKKKKNEEEQMLVITAPGGNETSPNAQLNESSPVSQKEEESMSFSRELDQQLSSRTISPELLEANRIIAEKDWKIEELNRLLNESRRQTSSTTLLLPNNLTLLIRRFPSTDFIIKHNGYEVISVQPARKDEISGVATTTAASLSQIGTSNNNQIQQQSQGDSNTIHQQYKDEAAH